MPAFSAAGSARADAPVTRRLVLLPQERRQADRTRSGPRRYRLARLEDTEAARADRFAHLKRTHD